MIMPMPYYPTSAGVGAQITMGESFSQPYYVSEQGATDFGATAVGSATGDLSADGGTIEILGQGNSTNVALYILGGNGTNPINVNIDGTDYSAAYQGLFSGYQLYSFGGSIFTIGNTYTVVVT